MLGTGCISDMPGTGGISDMLGTGGISDMLGAGCISGNWKGIQRKLVGSESNIYWKRRTCEAPLQLAQCVGG
jgi:hypothetical protein